LKPNSPGEASEEQAVIVFLTSCHGGHYTPEDLGSLEAELSEEITRLGIGEFDGDEIGLQSGDATLYMYGPDAKMLFAAIEKILRLNPLCQGARIILRQGGPGSPQKEIRI
jgi:hypothetical protein